MKKQKIITFIVILSIISVTFMSFGIYADNIKNLMANIFIKEEQLDISKFKLSSFLNEKLNFENVKVVDDASKYSNNEIGLIMNDGTVSVYTFAEDIKYKNTDGQIVYKDTQITSEDNSKNISDGFEYKNLNNDYKISFSSDSQKGIRVENEKSSFILLPNNNIKSLKNKGFKTNIIGKDKTKQSAFEFINIFGEETLLRYTPQLNAIKEEIVLSKYQGKNEFEFILDTGKNIAYTSDGTVIEIRDKKSSKVLHTFTPLFAYDSYGDGDYSVEKNHYTEDCYYKLNKIKNGKYLVTVCVSNDFLTNPDIVYPVTIDPTTASGDINVSTVPIYSTQKTTNFGSNTTDFMGRQNQNGSYGKGRILAKIPIPSAVSAYSKINSANYYCRGTSGNSKSATKFYAYAISDAWTPQNLWTESNATWEDRPSYDTSGSVTGATNGLLSTITMRTSGTDYNYSFNITKAVQAWVNNEMNNRGIVFRSVEEVETNASYTNDNNWHSFASNNNATSSWKPYVLINYTPDTTAPTITSVTGNTASWTNSNVVLTVNGISDDISGVNSTPYYYSTSSTIPSASASGWTSSKTYTCTSYQTVYIFTKDIAGNVALRSTQTVKIDKYTPSISSITKNPSNWTNQNVTITINMNTYSGGSGLTYSFDNGVSYQSSNSYTVTEKTLFPANTIKVKNGVGVVVSYPTAVNINYIDKVTPIITSISQHISNDGKTKLEIVYTDSDNQAVRGSFDNGNTWSSGLVKTYNVVCTIPANTIQLRDDVGNTYKYPYSINVTPGKYEVLNTTVSSHTVGIDSTSNNASFLEVNTTMNNNNCQIEISTPDGTVLTKQDLSINNCKYTRVKVVPNIYKYNINITPKSGTSLSPYSISVKVK